MRQATAVLAVLAGCLCAGQLAAQRQPFDVTLEVVEDVSGLDAAVMPLEPVEPGATDATEQPERADGGREDFDSPAAAAEDRPEPTAGQADASPQPE